MPQKSSYHVVGNLREVSSGFAGATEKDGSQFARNGYLRNPLSCLGAPLVPFLTLTVHIIVNI